MRISEPGEGTWWNLRFLEAFHSLCDFPGYAGPPPSWTFPSTKLVGITHIQEWPSILSKHFTHCIKHFAASSLPEQSLSHAHGFQSNQSRVILQLGLQTMTKSLSIKFYSPWQKCLHGVTARLRPHQSVLSPCWLDALVVNWSSQGCGITFHCRLCWCLY